MQRWVMVARFERVVRSRSPLQEDPWRQRVSLVLRQKAWLTSRALYLCLARAVIRCKRAVPDEGKDAPSQSCAVERAHL